MKKLLGYFSLAALSFTLIPTPASARVWTDTKGRTVDAQFVKLEDGNVYIRTADGRRHTFPLENLSHEDQVYARTAKAVEVQDTGNLTGAAKSAAIIDKIIDRDLVSNKLSPNDRTTDAEFFRRINLDIAGTIPNYQETLAFLQDKDPDKRKKLIDTLLESEDYVSHFYNYFADVLRLRNNLADNANISGDPYIHWVKDSIKENKSYDKMVHEMLTAEGKVWNNPATGYLLRDSGMQLDNLANTVSIFMGTEIACAQCHDHPFDDWTQMEFYEMAAFFGATQTQANNRAAKDRLMSEIQGLVPGLEGDEDKERNLNRQLDNLLRANRYEVSDMGDNRLRLPKDYKYDDAKPNSSVDPRFIYSKKGKGYVKTKKGEAATLRSQFADWVVADENPRFAMVIANRLWKRAFGIAVHDPVDDIADPEDCNNPELLEFLESEMKRLKYDMKEFQRVIYNTAAYQRKACAEAAVPGEPFHFQGPALRRMTAEQMWDSFVTLVLGDPNKYKSEDNGYYQRAMDVDVKTATGRTVLSKMTAAANMRGGMMMGSKGAESLAGMKMMRASELRQPEGAAHFLRQFGQSDRVLIEQATTDGTVPQVLMMLNGKATHMLTDPKSLIFKNMETVQSPAGKVEVVFLSILNRKPSLKERALAQREINKNGEWGYGDLIWALINTREFMFIR